MQIESVAGCELLAMRRPPPTSFCSLLVNYRVETCVHCRGVAKQTNSTSCAMLQNFCQLIYRILTAATTKGAVQNVPGAFEDEQEASLPKQPKLLFKKFLLDWHISFVGISRKGLLPGFTYQSTLHYIGFSKACLQQ